MLTVRGGGVPVTVDDGGGFGCGRGRTSSGLRARGRGSREEVDYGEVNGGGVRARGGLWVAG